MAESSRRVLGRRPARERILIVGCGRSAAETATALRKSVGGQDLVAGFVDPGEECVPRLPGPVLGRLEALETLLENESPAIGEIWLAADEMPMERRFRMVRHLQQTRLPVFDVPDPSLLPLVYPRSSRTGLHATRMDAAGTLIKSALDRSASAVMLVLLSPLLLALALFIRLDSPGPVLFRQPRHGKHGRVFEMLKFRSMKNAGEPCHEQAKRDDPRLTRVGRLMRRTSVDELPQLINVLRGDMSLVGPRPHPVVLNWEFVQRVPSLMQRHGVKPGITGWAQINGFRGETDTLEKMQKRLEHDLYYIENRSLWLDLRILLLTAVMGWRGANAW